jgi:hypothetical protein
MKESRKQQTIRELERLFFEVDEWKKKRVAADTTALGNYRGRYDTQLNQITAEILEAAKAVSSLLNSDLSGRTYAEVCREFNFHDQRIIWIRYVWNYFREKLDQRDDETLRPTLEAADEVLWSCYHAYFAGRNRTGPPPPIAGIAYDYTASALQPRSGHVLERRVDTVSGPMKEYFDTLPVGVLRLPPTVVTSPWTLSLIAHECGHFLQDAVEAGAPLSGRFIDKVEHAVRAAKGSDSDAKSWKKWAPEIFADWVAVLALGPWALWSLANWALGPKDFVARQPDSLYPPPLVRLYLIGQMAKGLDGVEGLLSALGVAEVAAVTEQAMRDLAIARAVADLTLEPLGDSQDPLGTHFDFRKSDYLESANNEQNKSEIVQWTECLLGIHERSAVQDLRAARLVAAAAVRAHYHLSTTLEGKPFQEIDLATRTRKMLVNCHEEGKRAAQPLFQQVPVGRLASVLVASREEDLII